MGIVAGTAILLGHLRIMGRVTVETGLGTRMVEMALIAIHLTVGAGVVAHQPVNDLMAGGAGRANLVHGFQVDFRRFMRCMAWDARLQGVVLLVQARVTFQAGSDCFLAFRRMLGMTCGTSRIIAMGTALFLKLLRNALMAGRAMLVSDIARIYDVCGTMRFMAITAVFRRHLGTVGEVTAQAVIPLSVNRMADAAVHGTVRAVKGCKGVADRTVAGQAGGAYRRQCCQLHLEGCMSRVAITAPLDDEVRTVLR